METSPIDIAGLRFDYSAHGLRRADLDPDPFVNSSYGLPTPRMLVSATRTL